MFVFDLLLLAPIGSILALGFAWYLAGRCKNYTRLFEAREKELFLSNNHVFQCKSCPVILRRSLSLTF